MNTLSFTSGFMGHHRTCEAGRLLAPSARWTPPLMTERRAFASRRGPSMQVERVLGHDLPRKTGFYPKGRCARGLPERCERRSAPSARKIERADITFTAESLEAGRSRLVRPESRDRKSRPVLRLPATACETIFGLVLGPGPSIWWDSEIRPQHTEGL